jgi:hypothetical protein
VSKRDLQRIDVLTEAPTERRTVVSAAETLALGVSERKDFLAFASAMQRRPPALSADDCTVVTGCTYCCSCAAKFAQRSSVYNPPLVAIFASSRRRLVERFIYARPAHFA